MNARTLLPVLLVALCLSSCSKTDLAVNVNQTAASQPTAAPAKELALDLGNNITMKLVLIQVGKFLMGSPVGEKDCDNTEGPQHAVTISKPFYMGVYTVTQEQWEHVMGTTVTQGWEKAKKQWGLAGVGANYPMYYISWEEAAEFCKKVSQKSGKTVRLPTEAQWEYACRAGSVTRFYYGHDHNYDKIGDYAWHLNNSSRSAHPVGQKKPNDWGLYDMHGNVCQWFSDWYEDNYTVTANNTDPAGPAKGVSRAVSGGCWDGRPERCRSASRIGRHPAYRDCYIGMRVVVDLK